MTLKTGLGSLKVIETDTYRSVIYDFLLTFHSNLSRTVSQTNGDFGLSLEIRKIPREFCAHADGVLLGIGYRRTESKNGIMGLPDGQKNLAKGLAV